VNQEPPRQCGSEFFLITFRASKFKEGIDWIVNLHSDFASSRLRVNEKPTRQLLGVAHAKSRTKREGTGKDGLRQGKGESEMPPDQAWGCDVQGRHRLDRESPFRFRVFA
jgi:hypothetical protein